MLNDAETRGEYPDNNLSCAPRIKWLNDRKNTDLKKRNSFIAHQGAPRAFLSAKQRE